ncbi:MAG: hypothetical protein V3V08_24710, partial [Nannocystaceae bacterium]
GSNNLNISATDGVPMTVTGAAVLSVPAGGDYTGNTDDRIQVLGRNLDRNGTIIATGVPYLISEDIRVIDGAAVTIEPGVSFHMAADTELTVGWNASDAEIQAVGTQDSPIVFSGVGTTAGYWTGITIERNVKSNSKFEFVTIGHAGPSASANLTLRRLFDITNSTLHDSAGYGILREGDDATDYVTPNAFEDNALGAVGEL